MLWSECPLSRSEERECLAYAWNCRRAAARKKHRLVFVVVSTRCPPLLSASPIKSASDRDGPSSGRSVVPSRRCSLTVTFRPPLVVVERNGMGRKDYNRGGRRKKNRWYHTLDCQAAVLIREIRVTFLWTIRYAKWHGHRNYAIKSFAVGGHRKLRKVMNVRNFNG